MLTSNSPSQVSTENLTSLKFDESVRLGKPGRAAHVKRKASMTELRIQALPYAEEGVLNFALFACNGGFSGSAELFQSPESVEQFGNALTRFPQNTQHTVTLEYGDGSDEWPYHVVLRAQVMNRTGHSAIYVRIQSFCSSIEAAICEFLLPAEPAEINELGRQLVAWLADTSEAMVWQPRA